MTNALVTLEVRDGFVRTKMSSDVNKLPPGEYDLVLAASPIPPATGDQFPGVGTMVGDMRNSSAEGDATHEPAPPSEQVVVVPMLTKDQTDQVVIDYLGLGVLPPDVLATTSRIIRGAELAALSKWNAAIAAQGVAVRLEGGA